MTETAAEAPRPVAPIGIDALIAGALLLAGAIVFLWYAPASYQIYLTLHILAVVVWVGGDITLTTLGIVFESKQDGPTLAALGRMGSLDRHPRLHARAVLRVRLRGRARREVGHRLEPLLDHLRASSAGRWRC